MITTENQFTTIPAFEYIAGCSIGDCTARETVTDMLKVLETCSSYDCLNYWRDIATTEDDQDLIELQDTIAQDIMDNCPIADFCTVELNDNEWAVTPFIDDELPKLYGIPETLFTIDGLVQHDVLVINDHGNTTLLHWDDKFGEYISVWTMV